MARTTNYSVLKKYLPKEQFDENYALISHYIQLQGTEKAEKYEKEIIAKNINLSLTHCYVDAHTGALGFK